MRIKIYFKKGNTVIINRVRGVENAGVRAELLIHLEDKTTLIYDMFDIAGHRPLDEMNQEDANEK